MKEKEIVAPKSTTKGDVAHALVKGVAGAIPFVGALTAESFGLAVSTPFQKRLNSWMVAVTERLNLLSDSLPEVTVQDLVEDERILSSITRTTEIALRTHDEEKRVALVEAVASSALGRNKILEGLFLEFLDSFQVSHLRFLSQVARNYSKDRTERLESRDFLDQFCKHELGGDQRLLYLHTEELEALRSLYTSDRSIREHEKGRKIRYLMLTDLGTEFIDFIGLS